MDSHKILAPVSWSENSANGLKYAINLAKTTNNELDILYVLNNSDEKKEGIPHAGIFKKELVTDFRYQELIRNGETSAEIAKIALELEPELIIMSSDIFNKEKKYFEESYTGKLIKESHYPILIITPKTEFKDINSIVLGTDMKENILESIQELLKIFRNQSPHINILVFSEKRPEWHFKEDVSSLIHTIKDYTEYNNIAGRISDGKDSCVELALYAAKENADLICMESDAEIFYNLFFHCKNMAEIAYILNKPILILPRHWKDSHKKA